jgi:hypothetical protein
MCLVAVDRAAASGLTLTDDSSGLADMRVCWDEEGH